jgi:hypothetical protein
MGAPFCVNTSSISSPTSANSAATPTPDQLIASIAPRPGLGQMSPIMRNLGRFFDTPKSIALKGSIRMWYDCSSAADALPIMRS